MDPFTIMALGSTAVGAYNAIQGGRQQRKMMDRMGPYLDLIYETAAGGGPLIESTVGGITRAGEVRAQIASRSVMAGGRANRPLALTLAGAQRIGAGRSAASAVGQIRSAALSPALGGQFAGEMFGAARGRMESGGVGMGMGLSHFLNLARESQPGAFTGAMPGPMPEIPNYQFQYGLPGRGGQQPRRFSLPGYRRTG